MPNKLTTTDIQRRKPVWFALARLWLSVELSDQELENTAQTMVDSGYSLSELRVIFDSEVVPAISNKETLGDWPNFDAVWLAQQIVSELDKPKRWQNALLDPIRRIFNGVTIESQWPILVMKYQRIQRMKTRIEL